MENTEHKENKKDQNKQSTSGAAGIWSESIIDIPFQIGRTIVNAVSNKDGESSEATNEGIPDSVSQMLGSAKDAIGENSGEFLEGIVKAAGEVTGGIADAVGDAISGLDF